MCVLCEMMGRSAAQTATFHAENGTPVSGGDAPSNFESETLAPGTTAASGKAVWSLTQVINNFERLHTKWAAGAVITYQFYDTAPAGLPIDVTFQPLTDIERQLVRTAFAELGDVANLTFVEAADDHTYGRSSSRISFYQNTTAEDYVWGSTVRYTRGYTAGNSLIGSAAIEFSKSAVDERRWFVGGYNFLATIHEIEHALGFPHPGDYNADGSSITYAANAPYYQDSRQYTALSYFDASSTGANYVPPGETASYSGGTPLLHDVAALQAVYGVNTATRAGDTVYGYNSTAGREAYDFTVNTHPVATIWDGGGADTIDLSGSSNAARLDLNAGEFSDVLGMTGNLSIAYGVTIENAKGSSAGDVIVGNEVANRLEGLGGDDTLAGRGGNDRLDGGAGTDTAAYGGASKDYDWWRNADGTWTVDDARASPTDGTDTLVDIEKLSFTDKTVTLTTPTAAQVIDQAWLNVLRSAPAGSDALIEANLAADVAAGRVTQAQAFAQITAKALATTSVATLAYEFFTGSTPTKAGLDYLVSPSGGNANNLNSAYYQSFSVENRYINFAVNLGKLGEGAAKFSAAYGGGTLFDAVKTAYTTIFGQAPTDAKLHDILDQSFTLNGATTTRAQYFAYYGGDGANGLGTKAAAVGWLLGEAAKADLGTYARSNEAFLTDLADGAHTHVDLVGVYALPAYALPAAAGG